MLRLAVTLATSQTLRLCGVPAAAMRAPSQKSKAVVAKSSRANGGFHAP